MSTKRNIKHINVKEIMELEHDDKRREQLRGNSFKPRTFEMTEKQIMESPITETYREFLPCKG